jgi:hypothetical protein
MHKQTIIFIGGLALAISSSTWAQNVQVGYSTFGPVETKAVTGAPYSATAITTSTQTLSDGTHITRTIQAQVARDSEGRTRREENITAVGPWSTGGSEQHLVSISDPVTQAHYVLRPEQQVAMKVALPPLGMNGGPVMAGAIAGPGIPGGLTASFVGTKVRQGLEEGGVKSVVKSVNVTDNAMWMAKEGTVMVIGASEKQAQSEDLGEQVIEGVRAHGRREKRTIAVGEIGNDRAIETSSETWFSDELQTIVLSKRTDPRMGDNEYRLTNISRTEPAASLFEVPAGYTIQEKDKQRE